jgi:hypothetical protein
MSVNDVMLLLMMMEMVMEQFEMFDDRVEEVYLVVYDE